MGGGGGGDGVEFVAGWERQCSPLCGERGNDEWKTEVDEAEMRGERRGRARE
jgi:hypothetical protein